MQKITRSPSYLVRNPHSYCFRINVPKDLQRYIEKKELRWSLRTGYRSVAKQKARALAYEVQTLFQGIRELVAVGDLSNQEIKRIVNEHIQNLLKSVEYLRIERFPLEMVGNLLPLMDRYIDQLGQEFQRQLVECNYVPAFQYARRMLP